MAMRAFRFLVLAMALLPALAVTAMVPAAAQTFNEAVAAYSRGDYATALRGYRRLVKQGESAAENNLGVMYQHGHGVPQSYAEAIRWYRRAAWRYNATAQLNLGRMHLRDDSVPPDAAAAVRWFRRSAEQGTAEAQLHLGIMYENGHGVPRDLVRAHIWYNLSASSDSAMKKSHRDSAVLGRDRVAQSLTAEQLALAQRLAQQQWQRRKKPNSTGSGFRVSAEGHILTNEHIVRGCTEVRVTSMRGGPSRWVAVPTGDERDRVADLALLKGPAGAPFAAFRRGRGVRPGADIVVAGYPLPSLLGEEQKVSVGIVAALAGFRGDPSRIHITAQIQPGNSGGPVFDLAGNVVGVVVGKLNDFHVAQEHGQIPQNVNFAVNAGTARAFLDFLGVTYAIAPSDEKRTTEEVAASAWAITVLVECWK